MDKLELRDAIFSLHTRKFGGVVEKLVGEILKEFGFIIKKPENISYDIQVNNKSDEVKGSRVLGKSVLDLKTDNIVESLLKHNSTRYVDLYDELNTEWDCNIQQIKVTLFDDLWYVLFFKDCVTIFKIKNSDIIKDNNISYSNKQHRGNEGEGQFHITNKNIKYHLDNYLVKIITYDDVYNKLTKNI